MDISYTAACYVHGFEEFIAANHIVATVEFKQELNPTKVFTSYKKLILQNPNLRVKWGENEKKGTFAWTHFSESEVDELLKLEKDAIMNTTPRDEIFKEYHATNSRLPFRIIRIDQRTLAFSWNHIMNNGTLLHSWFHSWLCYYAKESNQVLTSEQPPVFKTLSPLSRMKYWLFAPFWAILHLISLGGKSGKNPGANTVDLTHGKKTVPHRSGYSIKTYHFSPEETQKILEASKTKGLTVSGFLCGVFLTSLFEKSPDKNRILVNFPVDFRKHLAGTTPYDVGNYTGSVIFQVFKDRKQTIHRQIEKALRKLKRGVPYGVMRILNFVFRLNKSKLKKMFREVAAQSIPERAPVQNLTCVFAFIDDIDSPAGHQMIEKMSFTGFHQTVVICLLIVNGKLSIEISLPNDLMDPVEVFSITDLAADRLKLPAKGRD